MEPLPRARMSPAHRRFLLIETGVGAAVCNFALNALITWLAFMRLSEVPFWGQQSIAGSTVSTNFLLPFITCLIVTPLARKRVDAGDVAPLEIGGVLGWLPERTLFRGLLAGGVCMVLLSPPMLFAFTTLSVTSMTLGQFILFMATFTAIEGALVTPMLAAYAIGRTGHALAPT